jgi:hypothetical protein
MKQFTLKTLTLGLAVTLASAPVRAQTSGGDSLRPHLHVDDAYSSCFFDLHPELTQAEFDEFTAELGSILRPHQLGDTRTLGKGHFDVGLDFARTGINDAKGAWNNTMSHPTADHYLGQSIQFPRLVARLGVSDRVDLGVSGGLDPHSNWGLASVEARIVVMRQGPARPVSVAVRPSLTSLIGPHEVWVGNASLDILVSRALGSFAPYVGFSSSASLGVERSNDVDLDHAVAARSPVYAGVTYQVRGISLSAEVEHGKLNAFSIRTSTRF